MAEEAENLKEKTKEEGSNLTETFSEFVRKTRDMAFSIDEFSQALEEAHCPKIHTNDEIKKVELILGVDDLLVFDSRQPMDGHLGLFDTGAPPFKPKFAHVDPTSGNVPDPQLLGSLRAFSLSGGEGVATADHCVSLSLNFSSSMCQFLSSFSFDPAVSILSFFNFSVEDEGAM